MRLKQLQNQHDAFAVPPIPLHSILPGLEPIPRPVLYALSGVRAKGDRQQSVLALAGNPPMNPDDYDRIDYREYRYSLYLLSRRRCQHRDRHIHPVLGWGSSFAATTTYLARQLARYPDFDQLK